MGDLEVGKELLYLTREECKATRLEDDKLIELIEEGLSLHGEKRLEMPAKIGVHPVEDSLMHAMPADLPSEGSCGIKWVESFPDNPEQFDLPTTSGLTILNDRKTGWPVAVMDAVWITEKRTAAVSSVAAKYLSNPDDEVLGIIGCGTQGKAHASLLPKVMEELKKIYVFDIDSKEMDKLKKNVEGKVSQKIIKADSIKEVVENSSTLVTATVIKEEPDPQIKDEWISDGQTLLLIDMHSIWEHKTMERADKYLLDSIEEHELFAEYGYYPRGLPEVYAETGEVVAGIKEGREHSGELIVSNNVGMAVEDIIIANWIYEQALEKDLGRKLPL